MLRGSLPHKEFAVSQSIKVQIFDQTYQIAAGLDPDYVEELAQYVDERMREVARATGTVDSVKVAVLAALAIADELHALRQSREEGREQLRQRAERCLKLVERAIQKQPDRELSLEPSEAWIKIASGVGLQRA